MYFHNETVFLILCIFGFSKIEAQTSPSVYVNTSRGQLFGYHFDQGDDTSQVFYGQADVFLGIPYVQPPVGPLRYSKPVQLAQFPQNPYNATYVRSVCPQPGNNVTSEDCLYINIYTPNATSQTKYPVMVYIHGGALITGDNRLDLYGTVRNLVSRGVVVASIQYRLGFLGFFTTFTDDFPPNLGMLDQVEALKFINEEISNFGGDPTKITIFGESAGSASVSAHTYSPLSQPYFHQAIQESGAVLTCFEGSLGFSNRNFLYAQKACNYTIDQWNSANYTALKNCLMNINTSSGINFYNIVNGEIKNPGCWNMVQDNNFLPDVPRNLAKNRTNKPIIIGTNKDEWVLMMGYINANQSLNFNKKQSEYYISNQFAAFFGNQTQMATQILENLYIDPGVADDDHVAWLQYCVTVGTSFSFTSFSAKDAELYLLNNNTNVYMYEFTYWTPDIWPYTKYPVPGWQPVPHTAELPFVFFWGITESKTNMTNIKIANFFGETWTNFAKYGKPTMDDTWTRTKSLYTNMEYIDINQNPTMKSGYRAVDQVLFNRLLPIFLGTFPPEMPDYNNGSIIPTEAPPTSTPQTHISGSTTTSTHTSGSTTTSTHTSGSTTTSAPFFTTFIIVLVVKSF